MKHNDYYNQFKEQTGLEPYVWMDWHIRTELHGCDGVLRFHCDQSDHESRYYGSFHKWNQDPVRDERIFTETVPTILSSEAVFNRCMELLTQYLEEVKPE